MGLIKEIGKEKIKYYRRAEQDEDNLDEKNWEEQPYELDLYRPNIRENQATSGKHAIMTRTLTGYFKQNKVLRINVGDLIEYHGMRFEIQKTYLKKNKLTGETVIVIEEAI